MMPTKLLLKNHQSPGDIVMLTAAVRDLHLSHPGRFATDVDTTARALWENNPYITKLDRDDPDIQIIECHYPLIHKSNEGPWHFIHGFTQHLEGVLGIHIKPTLFRGDIHLTAEEKNWIPQVEEFGLRDPYWIVVAGGKRDFTAKIWSRTRWQEVVQRLSPRLKLVQVGEAGHDHPDLDYVLDLRGKTDIRQLVRLMYHADGVICPVTFAMHLATAVPTKPGRPKNRPCVVIAGGREPPQWEAYPHHQYLHTNGMLPCSDNGGCWVSRVVKLNDGQLGDNSLCHFPVPEPSGQVIPKCLSMISVDRVVQAVEGYATWAEVQPSPKPPPVVAKPINGPIPIDRGPTVAEMLLNYGKATIRDVRNGFRRVTEETFKERLAICRACPLWDEDARGGRGKCMHHRCGCTKSKLHRASENCPLDRWPSLRDSQIIEKVSQTA